LAGTIIPQNTALINPQRIRPPQLPADPNQAEVDALTKACLEKVGQLAKGEPDLRNTITSNNQSSQSSEFILAHAATESSFFVGAVGAQNELGLFQLKLSTANSLGLGSFTRSQLLTDGALNTRLGTTHMQNLINSFAGSIRTALAAYKQGESGVRNRGMTTKSQQYADAILECERLLRGK
jgi:hypothetical protein